MTMRGDRDVQARSMDTVASPSACNRGKSPAGTWEVAALVRAIHRDGYAIIPGALNDDLLRAARSAYSEIYPPWPDYAKRMQAVGVDVGGLMPEDAHLRRDGPFGSALDAVPLYAPIRELVAALLGPHARLVQSHLWAKYGQLATSYEQPHHVDFINHTVVYPSDDPRYAVLQFIVYYSDVDKECGPTMVVSRRYSDGTTLVPHVFARAEYPEYYEAEVAVTAPAGSILVYTQKTLHRVLAMADAAAHRMTHFFAYAPIDVGWLGWGRWLCAGYGDARRAFIENAGVEQLAAVGFPSLGSQYWTPETIRGTQALYPGLDLRAYLHRNHAAASEIGPTAEG